MSSAFDGPLGSPRLLNVIQDPLVTRPFQVVVPNRQLWLLHCKAALFVVSRLTNVSRMLPVVDVFDPAIRMRKV